MLPETRKIKELAPGVFYVLLWCPESSLLHELLDPQTPYVLCWKHSVGNYSWSEFQLPVAKRNEPINVLSRVAEFDFVMPTARFIEILPRLRPSISAVQLGSLPPDYLDMRKIKGKQLYRILGECGWHVMIDTPANDFGWVMSPKREIVERAKELTPEF